MKESMVTIIIPMVSKSGNNKATAYTEHVTNGAGKKTDQKTKNIIFPTSLIHEAIAMSERSII